MDKQRGDCLEMMAMCRESGQIDTPLTKGFRWLNFTVRELSSRPTLAPWKPSPAGRFQVMAFPGPMTTTVSPTTLRPPTLTPGPMVNCGTPDLMLKTVTVFPPCLATTANVPSGENSRTKSSVRRGAWVGIREGAVIKLFVRNNRIV